MAYIHIDENNGRTSLELDGDAIEMLALTGAISYALSDIGIEPKAIRRAVQLGIEGRGIVDLSERS